MTFVFVASCLVASVRSLSTQVNNDVFLQGTFVNLGVNYAGSLAGTIESAPSGAGFVTSPIDFGGTLGYRFDADGFGVGSPPTTSDFLIPG